MPVYLPPPYSRFPLSSGKVIAPTRWIIAAKFFPHRFICVIARRPVNGKPREAFAVRPTIQRSRTRIRRFETRRPRLKRPWIARNVAKTLPRPFLPLAFPPAAVFAPPVAPVSLARLLVARRVMQLASTTLPPRYAANWPKINARVARLYRFSLPFVFLTASSR